MKLKLKPTIVLLILHLFLIQITNQEPLTKKYQQQQYVQQHFRQKQVFEREDNLVANNPTGNSNGDDSINEVSSILAPDTVNKIKTNGKTDVITYFRTSIPIRIFQCIRQLTVLRCMKLFLLQKMENRNFRNTGNLTRDFLDQFLSNGNNLPSLIDRRYEKLNDTVLTNRLIIHFQKFFKNREIKLHFIPGVMMQVVPSNENKLKFSVKNNEFTGRKKKDKKKHSYKNTMIQMAVPVLMMPAILMGTFLPFMLPALKMATFMSTMLNNGALIAAIMYAARTTAQSHEAELVHYAHPGYSH